MIFFLRLMIMLVLGLTIAFIVALVTHSATLSVAAFLLWCLNRQKAVLIESEEETESD